MMQLHWVDTSTSLEHADNKQALSPSLQQTPELVTHLSMLLGRHTVKVFLALLFVSLSTGMHTPSSRNHCCTIFCFFVITKRQNIQQEHC
jgi:hypothetical protein